MSAVYLETSALLSWLLGQSRAGHVREALDAASVVLTSELTLTEAERALVRAEHEQLLTGGDGQRLRGLIQRSRAAPSRSSRFVRWTESTWLPRSSLPAPLRSYAS